MGSPLLRLVSGIKAVKSRIRDLDIELLAASPNVSGVRRLMLLANAIGDRGAQALATSPSLIGLTSLQLSANRIGDAGAAALAHSDSLRGLTELNLACNRIGDPGAQAFLTTQLPALERLTLFDNPAISDRVASELVRHGGPAWDPELLL